MRKTFLLTLVLCLFIALQAGAAQAAEAKIGVFNMAEVALECDAFKEAQKKLKDTYGKDEQALTKKEQELKKKFDDFAVKQAGLSAEARQDRQVALMREKRDHDDRKNDFMRKIAAAEGKTRDQISRAIVIAVGDYGKKNKYSMIIDSLSAGVFYLEPSMDITKDILRETNRVWKEKPKKLTDGSPLTTGAN